MFNVFACLKKCCPLWDIHSSTKNNLFHIIYSPVFYDIVSSYFKFKVFSHYLYITMNTTEFQYFYRWDCRSYAKISQILSIYDIEKIREFLCKASYFIIQLLYELSCLF